MTFDSRKAVKFALKFGLETVIIKLPHWWTFLVLLVV